MLKFKVLTNSVSEKIGLCATMGTKDKGRMSSSGILSRVVLVRTDFSEELNASTIRETRIGEIGTMLAVLVTLMMEELRSSETSLLTRATLRNIP
jgi:hypothetical protein